MAAEHLNSPSMEASWKLEFIVTTLISVCFFLISSSEVVQGQGKPQFPALIVLGDSNIDAGNNNNINTPAKWNFPPYGRDFPGGIPIGRFSNGKLTLDFLGMTSKYSTFIFLYTFQGLNNFSQSHFYIFWTAALALGIKETIPAYLDPELTSDDLITGVTFASVGSGYDNATSESGVSKNPWHTLYCLSFIAILFHLQFSQSSIHSFCYISFNLFNDIY